MVEYLATHWEDQHFRENQELVLLTIHLGIIWLLGSFIREKIGYGLHKTGTPHTMVDFARVSKIEAMYKRRHLKVKVERRSTFTCKRYATVEIHPKWYNPRLAQAAAYPGRVVLG